MRDEFTTIGVSGEYGNTVGWQFIAGRDFSGKFSTDSAGLIINEAAQLGDQLPMLVRGIYYEAWHPAGKPEKIRSREEFFAKIATRMAMKQSIDPESAARAVFQTMEHHVSPGEIRDVMQELPEDIRALWPPLEEAAGRAGGR